MRRYFVGLDVSKDSTAICIVGHDGEIVFRGDAESNPQSIAAALQPFRKHLVIVGHEAGSLSAYLHQGLVARKLPMVCMETQHTKAMLSASRANKSDANDARGLAQILRAGWFKTVHIKSDPARRIRLLLRHREGLKKVVVNLENLIRSTLETAGIRLPVTRTLAMRRKLVAVCGNDIELRMLMESIWRAREAALAEYRRLDELVHHVASNDPVCRLLMSVPGCGPVTALAYRAAVDDPMRFKRSRTVAAHFGLTPVLRQSGKMLSIGSVSRRGDPYVRRLLFLAAKSILTISKKKSPLKRWGLSLAERKGFMVAAVALARKLAVLFHRLWITNTPYTVG